MIAGTSWQYANAIAERPDMSDQSDMKTVLMCCSDLDYKGGMVSVVKNYLSYEGWGNFDIRFVPTHVTGGKTKVALHFALVYPKLVQMFSRHKIDLVHLHVAERGSFYRKALIARAAKKRDIPVVFHHHAAEFMLFYSGLDSHAKDFVRETIELVDVNIVLSEAIRCEMAAAFPDARFEVLVNAVSSLSENPYSIGSRNIVFMGRLGDRKGTFVLLDAFSAALPQIGDDWRLLLCGDGDIERAETAIAEKGLGDRAQCLGWVSGEDKDGILRTAGINVLPSYNEGLPMSILEAMSYGVPTVSTRIAAIPEVIDSGQNGLLIDPGDVKALSADIVELCNNQKNRLAISREAFATIAGKFSFETNIGKLKELYRTLC